MIAPSHLRLCATCLVQSRPVPLRQMKSALRIVRVCACVLMAAQLLVGPAPASNHARIDTLHTRSSSQAFPVVEQSNPAKSSSDERPIRQLERREIEDLISRGEDFIVRGDFASARLVLQRAAEAGNAKAALLLAGTYDPIVLLKARIQGFAADVAPALVPDVALARTWYERARKLGSAEAARRLDTLTGHKDTRAAPQE
jgi:hypothetical protein